MCIHARAEPVTVLVDLEVEDLFALPEGAMEEWRSRGFGPDYVELTPGDIRYLRSDVDNFLKSRRKRSDGAAIPPWE